MLRAGNDILVDEVNNCLAAHGFGAADPVASNATPLGRSQNRRVVLSVTGQAAEGSSGAQ